MGEMDKLMLEEFRGRALLASELVALEWSHILRWYGLEEAAAPEQRF